MGPETNVVKSKKAGRKASALRKSAKEMGQSFSQSADRVADIILEDHQKDQGEKTKKITAETISMVKELAQQVRANLKDLQPVDFLVDASYKLGQLSGRTRRAGFTLLNYFME